MWHNKMQLTENFQSVVFFVDYIFHLQFCRGQTAPNKYYPFFRSVIHLGPSPHIQTARVSAVTCKPVESRRAKYTRSVETYRWKRTLPLGIHGGPYSPSEEGDHGEYKVMGPRAVAHERKERQGPYRGMVAILR